MYKKFHNYLKRIERKFWKNRKSDLKPSIFQFDYLHYQSLSRDIARGFIKIRKKIHKKKLTIVDVGCGHKPYLPLFAPHAKMYIGVDIDPAVADVVVQGEKIPFNNDSFDLVVSFQTLEHCDDPGKVVSEMHRVLTPSGFALVSTHGAWIYHPNPNDYYRWTEEGLVKLFSNFSSVSVKSNLGTVGSLLQLINIELYTVSCKNIVLKLPLYGVITLLNMLGRVVHSFGASNFTLNYLVIAKK